VATAIAILPVTEPPAVVAEKLATLLRQAETESIGDHLPQSIRDQATDLIEVLRSRVRIRPERDPRSLFDIDDRLVELMNRAEDEANENGDIPESLAQEITDYLEAFRGKVDRIAGYWRWQESIGAICGQESDRLAARKRAADARVVRLRAMLLAFMQPRGLKRLEGEKAAIGLQQNSTASLQVDDPLQVGERFWERSIRLTRTELQEITYQLAEGDLRRQFEAMLNGEGWEINSAAVRAAIVNGGEVPGARLVKGSHVRVR
jgi:hypothetical protein